MRFHDRFYADMFLRGASEADTTNNLGILSAKCAAAQGREARLYRRPLVSRVANKDEGTARWAQGISGRVLAPRFCIADPR